MNISTLRSSFDPTAYMQPQPAAAEEKKSPGDASASGQDLAQLIQALIHKLLESQGAGGGDQAGGGSGNEGGGIGGDVQQLLQALTEMLQNGDLEGVGSADSAGSADATDATDSADSVDMNTLLQQLMAALQQMQGPAGGDDGQTTRGDELTGMLEQMLQAILQQFSGQEAGGPTGGGGGGGGGIQPTSGGATGGSVPQAPGLAQSPAAPQLHGAGQNTAPASAPQRSESVAPTSASAAGGGDATKALDDMLKSKGLNAVQRAGVMGNIQHESNMHADINQGGQRGLPSANMADDNANGYGLAQWGGVRKQALIDFAGSPEKAATVEAQVAFISKELDGEYKGVVDQLKNARTVGEATAVWQTGYEKASDPQMGSRLQYAEDFAKKLA